MIVSYHPLFEGDVHGLAAGRDPSDADADRIGRATAVILPQGCRESWYRLAKDRCPHVFPDYDARFGYPGKAGQIRLFRAHGIRHPETRIFDDLSDLTTRHPEAPDAPPLPLPFVFKFGWGDEGRTVHLVSRKRDWVALLDRACRYETTGQRGFLLQRFIPSGNRSLRIAVIGTRRVCYWRVLDDGDGFAAGVGQGARIDTEADPHLRQQALAAADVLCRRTGINLAGLDVLFSVDPAVAPIDSPHFIEINYYFGRAGLGGSKVYYRLLLDEIHAWLEQRIGLPRPSVEEVR